MAQVFNTGNFDQEVLKSSGPVLVDFYADWCGPCKMMGPVVEKLSESYADKVKIGKLNVDESDDIASRYGVMSIPTFILFKDGQAVQSVKGAVPVQALEQMLDQAVAPL